MHKICEFTYTSLETIVATRTDLVIGVNNSSHPVKTKEIERLGIKIALISVTSLDDILNSFKSVARLLGRPEAGERLVHKITRQFEEVKKRVAPVPRRSTLLAVGLRPLVAV